ncbi:MAG: zinc ribbon domain-containing protein [Candidatus Omnitrophota bacterium]
MTDFSSPAITVAARRRTEKDAREARKKQATAEKRRAKKEANLTPEQREAGRLRRAKDARKRSEAEGTVARRIRIRPTVAQRAMLRTALGASRYIYNRGAEIANAETVAGQKPSGKKLQKAVRAAVTNNAVWRAVAREQHAADWTDIPYEVRDSAVRDLAKAIKSTKARCESEAAAKGVDARAADWTFKLRAKKDPTESLTLRKRNLDGATLPWFRTMFGTPAARVAMASDQPMPATFGADVRLLHDKVRRRYFLIVPVPPPAKGGSDIKAPRLPPTGAEAPAAAPAAAAPAPAPAPQRQLALDPGVRTFMTGYDPAGLVVEWGGGETNGKLWRLANTANGIRARMTKPGVAHGRRQHMRRAAARVEARIRNMVDELHHKFAAWACVNYDLILLPKFQTRNMAKKGRRRISRKTVSRMYTLAHYRFRQFMVHKAKQRGVTLFIVDEAYTSKTCGHCGRMHEVGSRKLFTCPYCGLVVDRDIGAARNIAIKFVNDNP